MHGKITTTKMEGIGYASIEVKDIRLGTITKNDGEYQLFLEAGAQELVVTMIGYKSQTLSIVVDKDYMLNIILEEDDSKNLSEVVVKAKLKDRAEEIVRNVIRNKEEILAAAGPYSYDLYIKAVQQDSGLINKKGKNVKSDPEKATDENLARMAMVEILARVDYESDNRIKEERTGVKRNGNPESLFYLSATQGNFNFYNNLIKVPTLSSIPFLSPVSYSGLVAYKFKTIKVQRTGKHKIYTISVKPKQMSNATVEGEITISDSSWAILHTKFQFPRFHMPEYDFFEVEQQYNFVDNKAWMITRQQFTYYSKAGPNRKLSGQTTALYSNHVLNKEFAKKHFGRELSATAQEAYEKDSSFWETARTEPLTEKELSFIRYRDSLYRATQTKQYLDSIDKLTNKATWKKIGFLGQTIYDREKDRTWHLPPVTSVFQPFAVGGIRINPSVYYAKTYKSRKNFSLYSHLSYGIRNNDVNGSIRIKRMYNPFNRGFYSVSISKDFQPIFKGDAWINALKRSNYYLSNKLSLGHGLEIANGLFFYTDFDIAFRRSISDLKTGKLVDSLLGDVLNNNKAIPFEPYNAVYGKIRLHYTPKQRFIREPKEKVILGSTWPTFYTMLSKGVPGIFNSKVNFDYLEFGMEQQINVGLMGVSRYNIKTGNFFNKTDLKLVDYQFQRQGDPLFYMNPDEAFQALDSTFPLFERFYQGHFVHEFNGVMLNKIPLLKKLQLREVGGAGFLVAPERNLRYAEAFAGVERVFKWPFNPLSKFKLGVYVLFAKSFISK
ncbi:MAG: DUF5686 and carboxypeptidase regulatory-like domain-containing protein [Chitinophagaceae bacterium]